MLLCGIGRLGEKHAGNCRKIPISPTMVSPSRRAKLHILRSPLFQENLGLCRFHQGGAALPSRGPYMRQRKKFDSPRILSQDVHRMAGRASAVITKRTHVHVLFWLFDGEGLAGILGSWKKFTSRRVNAMMNRRGMLWQDESYDHWIRNY